MTLFITEIEPSTRSAVHCGFNRKPPELVETFVKKDTRYDPEPSKEWLSKANFHHLLLKFAKF